MRRAGDGGSEGEAVRLRVEGIAERGAVVGDAEHVATARIEQEVGAAEAVSLAANDLGNEIASFATTLQQ